MLPKRSTAAAAGVWTRATPASVPMTADTAVRVFGVTQRTGATSATSFAASGRFT
jgi:hypothetical protein